MGSSRSRSCTFLLLFHCVWSQHCIAPGEYCLNGGTCISQESGDFCACDLGWLGVFCECNCHARGICVSADTDDDPIKGRLKCACIEGFVGTSCSIVCSNAITCSGNGQCTDEGRCECDEPWAGKNCNMSHVCAQCEIVGGGACVNETCVCFDDRRGPTCNCSDSHDCSGNGQCNASSATVDCKCDLGFSGTACEISPTPAPVICSQLSECADCQLIRDCMWTESHCERKIPGGSQVPDDDNCEAESAPKSVWVPIVVSLGGLMLLLTIFYGIRRFRKYSEVKQLALNSNLQGGAPTTPWFSDLAAVTEEYVYMDPDEDSGD